MRRLLSHADLLARGVSHTTTHLARLEKAGRWPKRIKLGHRSIAWYEDEIDAEIEKRAAERDRSKPAA